MRVTITIKRIISICIFGLILSFQLQAQYSLKILNFQADNGFQHDSKKVALDMIETSGAENNWEVVTSSDTADISPQKLHSFNVLIIKTNLTLPYTSVFFQLECGYWNAAAEENLRT